MIKKKNFGKPEQILLALATLSFFPFLYLYYTLVSTGAISDIDPHAMSIIRMLKGEIGPQPNFIYYLLVYVFSGFSSEMGPLLNSSIFVIAAAKAASVFTSGWLMISFVSDKQRLVSSWWTIVAFAAIAIAIQFPYNISYQLTQVKYLGQFTPTIWHNSTTILLLPFATMLFKFTYDELQLHSNRNLKIIGLLAVLNCFIKPSFFIALVPAYGLLLLFTHRPFKLKVKGMLPMVTAVLIVAAMTVAIYIFDVGSYYEEKSELAIMPFYVWINFMGAIWYNLPLGLILSILFPALVYVYYYFYLKLNRPVIIYSSLVFFFALLIFILFAELGPRLMHGNFLWQTFIASHMLFVVAMGLVLDLWIQKRIVAFLMFMFVFMIHLLYGVRFLRIYLITLRYI